MSLPAKVLNKLNNREVGKPTTLPYLSALSHFKHFLGLKMARLACFPQRLFSTLAGTKPRKQDGPFLLTRPKINEPARCGNTKPALTSNERGTFAMANRDFTDIPQEVNFDHLSEAELSALLDLLTSQIEYHRDELARLKPLLRRLQAQIPNNPFADFIKSLD